MTRVVPTAILASRGSRVGTGEDILANKFGEVDRQPAAPQDEPASATETPAQLYELGQTLSAMGFHTAAIAALQDCVAHAPDHANAWRELSGLLRLAAKDDEADAAEAAAAGSPSSGTDKWPGVRDDRTASELDKADDERQAEIHLKSQDEAMIALRDRLVEDPLDVVAMRLLAQREAGSGDEITALRLLERALEISPRYFRARESYADVLGSRHAYAALVAQTAMLLENAPDRPGYRAFHAQALMNVGESDAALDILIRLLRENPNQLGYWLTYARALHFAGRRDECVQAHRHCLQIRPDCGVAYWGLADLKDTFITDADIRAMRTQLARDDLESESRRCMLYALGQALERTGDFAASFAAYDEAVLLDCALLEEQGRERADGVVRKTGEQTKTDSVTAKAQAASGAGRQDQEKDRKREPGIYARRLASRKTVFSRENFATRLVPAPPADETPIFVVGLPRAGSTLVEQILSSHSQVEGTRELELIGEITRDLELARMLVKPSAYPEIVLDLKPDRLAALGARYIERSRSYRRLGRSTFIDKRPWNWLEVGLIHLILPQAKIIDIRRKPMAACFAMFKQLLPDFSYDLEGFGWYYNNYVSMMEHWESALPGRVHFVQYERLVEDTDNEIRRMLDYCGLPFEESCLRFWQTDRVVATPSGEQVRRPIYRQALDQWRNFEPWLGPLKEALNQRFETA
ncbi:MAG TPA: sulfotransferase [Rhizomicrobium sp.]|jgi:tetratricopeptide (TPR) repeat protein